ncbi:MAG: hypothetical protein BLM47_04865 [Candidatus Reconcilbacillus cellulovorans]|uniref:ArsA HSP20-like domain-containing protein n=1 Tax=Candidatus Reconcilbacillus cellulovorans TaxID=1906605 RepID=A0A2A6E1D0_9BACL|nr:MAG: hypothetical protein BLM47_04865 [Candidatus Reconcilbacillus cellulovorans]
MPAGFPFPWNQFERLFGIRPPENIAELALDPERLDTYVREEIDRCLRKATAPGASARPDDGRSPIRTAEIGRTLTVRIAVPPRIEPDRLRIRAGRWHVRIEAHPSFGIRTVRLPSAVEPATGRAVLRRGYLEIRFRKAADEPLFDIPVGREN